MTKEVTKKYVENCCDPLGHRLDFIPKALSCAYKTGRDVLTPLFLEENDLIYSF